MLANTESCRSFWRTTCGHGCHLWAILWASPIAPAPGPDFLLGGCCPRQSSPVRGDDQSESCSKDDREQRSSRCKGGVRCWRSHQPEEWREEGGQAWEEGGQAWGEGGRAWEEGGPPYSHARPPSPHAGQAWGEDWVQPSEDLQQCIDNRNSGAWGKWWWCRRERIFCCCRAHPCAAPQALCLRVGMYQWPSKDNQTPMPNIYLRVGSSVDVTKTQLIQVFGSSCRSIVKYCECNLHK